MPSFKVARNELINGFHIFRDGKEVTFISNDVFLDLYGASMFSFDTYDFNKHIVTVLRNMKVIKLHPSQYTIEKVA